MNTPIPVSMVTCAGRFRDNRRGMLKVHALGQDLAEIVIDQPPQFGTPGTRTTIAVAGERIATISEQLRALADALEDVTDLNAWRKYEPTEPEHRTPWHWQSYPVEVEEATA